MGEKSLISTKGIWLPKFTKHHQKEVKPPYFSWTLITLWTIGMSRPSTLKTTISPALIGSSRKFVRNRRSPLWKAGSILPLGRNAKSHPISLDSQRNFQFMKNTKVNVLVKVSTSMNHRAGLGALNQATVVPFWLLTMMTSSKKGNDFSLD